MMALPMSPVGLSPEVVSPSSPVLWAQPSKEWVIPAKPKPGRKPKKQASMSTTVRKDDAVSPSSHHLPKLTHFQDDEPSGSRRLQNRAAQRAFRERKQSQLSELQARLSSYEQGEIERNVALQNVAKKMKEENDELRRENQTLRDKIARLEQERDELLNTDSRRACADKSTSSPAFPPTDNPARKRARVDEDTEETLPPTLLPSFPSPSSSLPRTSEDTPPAAAFSTREHECDSRQSMFPTPPPINNVLLFATTNETTGALDSQDPIDDYPCVLCSPDAPCLCKELIIQQTTSEDALHQLPVQSEDLDQQPMISLGQSVLLDAPPPPTAGMSILDNLPAFQAPVPIRRRTGASRAAPIFPVMPTPIATVTFSKCSGDPDNCMACADDSFGKAFCQAIEHKVNATIPCTDCPKRATETGEILVGGCCGDITKCGSCGIAPIISSTIPQRGPETIPTDDAWRQLKSHPNVAFGDLSLLAEVVARRSKCTGSRVVISPAPGAAMPDRASRLSHHEPNSADNQDQSVLLTDPHEHFRQKQQQRESPPRLVPQHVLIECGRRRLKEVNTDGVREALRLLDQKFAHMR